VDGNGWHTFTHSLCNLCRLASADRAAPEALFSGTGFGGMGPLEFEEGELATVELSDLKDSEGVVYVKAGGPSADRILAAGMQLMEGMNPERLQCSGSLM
jgi:hypothetical protein